MKSLSTSDIQTRDETSVSMMPPHLFEALTNTEVLDLVAYLRTDSQGDMPSE